MKNPFEYGDIVLGDSFCNRVKESKDIRRTIENAQNMVVFSERRLGKTSLVKRVLNSLPDQKYYCVYVDLWPTDGKITFIQTLAEALAGAHKSTGEQLLDWAGTIYNVLSPTVSMSKEGEPQLNFNFSSTDNSVPALKDVLEAPEIIREQTEKKVVVVLDEIQVIRKYENGIVENQLRSSVQTQSEVCFLYLGSRRHLIQDMFMDEESPLFKSGTNYPLDTIAEEDWEPFIRERFEQADKSISKEIIKIIVSKTDGHPFYTQHFCHVLWEITETGKTLEQDTLEKAINILLDREKEVYMTRLDSLTKNQKRLLIALALEEGYEQIYSEDFTRKYGLTPAKIQRSIDSLKQNDLIDLKDDKYIVRDRFLRLWIQRRFNNVEFS